MEMILLSDVNDGNFEKFKFDLDVGIKPIGLDTETSGLDCFSELVYLVQVYIDGAIYMFDCESLGKEYLTKIVKEIKDSNRKIVMHNAKFDIKMIKQYTGILLTNVHDTMWTETLIHLGVGDVLSKLSTLVEKYTGVILSKDERKNFYTNYTGLTQELINYSALDVMYLTKIYEKQMEQVERDGLMRVYNLESELVPVVAKMEYDGILLDVEKWTKMADANAEKLAEARENLQTFLLDSIDYSKYEDAFEAFTALLIKDPVKTKKAQATFKLITGEDDIKKLVRQEFNFGSNPQMLNLLRMLGVNIDNTNEKTLREHKSESKYIDMILEFRDFEKKESTYGRSFLEHINPKTGRIHTELLNIGARTGRFSSNKPNLQNIPRGSDYRSCFISRPGHKLIAVDYSQQEYRLVGAVSNEPVIIQAYLDGIDMHTSTAMIATGKKKEDIVKDDRNLGKSLNFAIIYGSTEYGLAHNLKITVDKGKEILDNFYSGYPVLAAFKKAVESIILNVKYSVTPLGRRRYFEPEPTFADSRELQKYRSRLAREGFNMIIQGGGADITKLALVKLFYTNPFGDKFRLLLQVHDEIVAEASDDIAEDAKLWMEQVMRDVEQPFLGKIPAVVDGAMDNYWVH